MRVRFRFRWAVALLLIIAPASALAQAGRFMIPRITDGRFEFKVLPGADELDDEGNLLTIPTISIGIRDVGPLGAPITDGCVDLEAGRTYTEDSPLLILPIIPAPPPPWTLVVVRAFAYSGADCSGLVSTEGSEVEGRVPFGGPPRPIIMQ